MPTVKDKTLHIEVCQNFDSLLTDSQIIELSQAELESLDKIELNKPMYPESFTTAESKTHINSIICCAQEKGKKTSVKVGEFVLKFYIYKINPDEEQTVSSMNEELQSKLADMKQDGVVATTYYLLPSKEFFGLWESLPYKSNVKELFFDSIMTGPGHLPVTTSIYFSNKKEVDKDNSLQDSPNKLVLLHGSAPNVEKINLCKALAQKISVCFRDQYQFDKGEFVEINFQVLFSKWPFECGKLIKRFFKIIKRLLEDPKALVFVVLDEIDPSVHAGQKCMKKKGPCDCLKAVNEVILREINRYLQQPNILFFTTSTVAKAKDSVFADLAVIKQCISPLEEK